MLLTSGATSVGAAAVAELVRVAVGELATQGALSRAAVAKGGDVAAERVILSAWRDYYVAALPTLRELVLDGAALDAAIAAGQASVRASAERVLATLK